ncbi:MAG: tetratricopeptide repeat protein [Chromatiales bacterium]|nr:tetratricopeptide repeat protein [Chromatiales bacterium]
MPKQPELYFNMGALLGRLGRLDDAISLHCQALELNPNSPQANNNLGLALQDLGDINETLRCFDKAIDLDPSTALYLSNKLFVLNYHPDQSAENIFLAYKDFDCRFGQDNPIDLKSHENERNPFRRLRLGYVSPDFCSHSVSYFFRAAFGKS